MATRRELDAAAQRVPNQKGPQVGQVEGLTYWDADITKIPNERFTPDPYKSKSEPGWAVGEVPA
jgi:hypothetical protein